MLGELLAIVVVCTTPDSPCQALYWPAPAWQCPGLLEELQRAYGTPFGWCGYEPPPGAKLIMDLPPGEWA